MYDLNNLVLQGRIVRNAEFTTTDTGLPVARFSIASNRYRKVGEEYVEVASYFPIVLFGKPAVALRDRLVRGQQMTVEGFLKQDKWEKDGVKHSEIKIGIIRVYLTGYPPAQTQEGISSNPVPAQGNVAVSAAELSTEICPPEGLGFEEAVPF